MLIGEAQLRVGVDRRRPQEAHPALVHHQVGGERNFAVHLLDGDAGLGQLDGGAGDAHGGQRVEDAQVAAVEAQLHGGAARALELAGRAPRPRQILLELALERQAAPLGAGIEPPCSASDVPPTRLPSPSSAMWMTPSASRRALMSSVESPRR